MASDRDQINKIIEASRVAQRMVDEASGEVVDEVVDDIRKIAEVVTKYFFQEMYRVMGRDETPYEVRKMGITWNTLHDDWSTRKVKHWGRYKNGPPHAGTQGFAWGISPQARSLHGYIQTKKFHANFGVPKAKKKKLKGRKGYRVMVDLYPRLDSVEEAFDHLRGRQKLVDRFEGIEVRRPFFIPMLRYTAEFDFKDEVNKL